MTGVFSGQRILYRVKRLVIENCSSLYSPTPVMGEKTTRGIFLGYGVLSLIKEVVANCNGFLCVFLHFREQPNISVYLLTESGPCNIVTGLSKAVCFQLKGI